MLQTNDVYNGSNPPSPPPPEYDAMTSRMVGAGFNLSAPDDLLYHKSRSFAMVPVSKPRNISAWPIPMDISPPEDDILPLSDFTDRLHTNYIPNSSEIAAVKEYVAAISEKVSAYDTRIKKLESALSELKRKRADLRETVVAHEALVSPLRRLPPEILQLIFVWCLPQNRNAVMHASEAPVILGRICSEWRRISLATPELWATLHIVPPNVNFSNPTTSAVRFQAKRDLVKTWLGRSGACPLSISLVWFAGDSEEEVKLCGTLLEVLVPHCRQWKVLDFQVPLKMFKPFMGLTVEDAPFLEGVSLMDNRTPLDAEAVDRWPESLSFVEGSLCLRNFTLTFFSGGIHLPTIPWHQLTVIYLESNIAFFFRDVREMLTALGACSSLISCTLKFPLSHTASLPPYDCLDYPITLPHLQVLCVDGDQHLHNTFHMSNTLVNLCAPQLRRLEILGRSGRPEGNIVPEPLCAIKTLLQRSRCPLEKLNVESMTMVPEEFIACLRLVPTLTELIVHNWSVRIMVGLTPMGEDEVDANEVAENQILKALTVSKDIANGGEECIPADVEREDAADWMPKDDGEWPEPISAALSSIKFHDLSSQSPSSFSHSCSSPEPPLVDHRDVDDVGGPLCPNLERFDFTLCDASQSLLCDFVASRWSDLPEGITQIRTVKCNFTAFEDETVKARMQRFRSEGLDAFVTYQVPINDDVNPSPWTGLEGPP